jgi:hypothetical protein
VRELDRPLEIVPVLYGQFVYHLLKGLVRLAEALAAELLGAYHSIEVQVETAADL